MPNMKNNIFKNFGKIKLGQSYSLGKPYFIIIIINSDKN